MAQQREGGLAERAQGMPQGADGLWHGTGSVTGHTVGRAAALHPRCQSPGLASMEGWTHGAKGETARAMPFHSLDDLLGDVGSPWACWGGIGHKLGVRNLTLLQLCRQVDGLPSCGTNTWGLMMV